MDKCVKVLVVDDDESIRKVLRAVLEEEGHSVEVAGDGKEAIGKSKRGFYNLALIDIRLPDMEGTELLSRMKETVPRMRKIVMTGYPSLQNAIDAVNRNADAYVLKPFDMTKVLETIREQLSKQLEEQSYCQDKVASFIETRVKELETQQATTTKHNKTS